MNVFLTLIVGQQRLLRSLPIGDHILMFLDFSFSILVLLIRIHHKIYLTFLVSAMIIMVLKSFHHQFTLALVRLRDTILVAFLKSLLMLSVKLDIELYCLALLRILIVYLIIFAKLATYHTTGFFNMVSMMRIHIIILQIFMNF